MADPKKISALPVATSVNTNDYTILVDGSTVQNKRATVAQIMAASGGGTVTSVGLTGANGVSVTGGPITSSGSITVGLGAITPSSVTSSGTVTGSNLSGTNTGDQTIQLIGDVLATGGTGTLTTSIANGAVTNAHLANMSGPTVKGRASGTGVPSDLSMSTLAGMLPTMLGDSGSGGAVGLAPAPTAGSAAAKKFLRADATWSAPAINDLLPSQAANGGKFLTTDGNNVSWAGGLGTVSSVAIATDGNISVSGSPITTAGTISLSLANSGATAGTFGSATTVPTLTVDAKGRITSSGSTPITFPVNSVAGRTGNVTLSVNDISGLGTLAQQNTNALALTGTVSSSASTTTHKYPITINGTTYYLLLSNV
jgi:hypothetical protein